MHRTVRSVGIIILAATAVFVSTAGAGAQDFRANPFLPEATPEEAQILAEKERMRQVIREMMPDIKTMLTPTFDEQDSKVVDAVVAKLKEDPTILGVAAPAAGGDAQGAKNGAPGAAPGAEPADPTAGMKLIACINGKAVYRDANGIKQVFGPPVSDKACSPS